MRPILTAILAIAMVMAAHGSYARDILVLVGNTDYDDLPGIRRGLDFEPIRDAANQNGFDVLELSDAEAPYIQDRFSERVGDLSGAERLIVVLGGHFATDGNETWLLGTDAPRGLALFEVGRAGLPLSPLMRILAGKPGSGFLMLATDNRPLRLGTGLETGVVTGDIPQGVTVVEGEGDALLEILVEGIFAGVPAGSAVAARPGDVIGRGYLPEMSPIGDAGLRETVRTRAAERVVWLAAEREGTVESYENYLRSFPDGRYSDVAQGRIAEMNRPESPEAMAAGEESELKLSRQERAQVQRNLSVIGYDPRGIDGIFGPGTRSALSQWQRDEGLEATGYITGNQLIRLEEAAVERQAALEEEAQLRQEERDRADARFWQDTGADGSERGLREYLESYPDGLYAEQAERELSAIEAERQAEAAEADREAWDEAAARDTVRSYERYLDRYPDGAFASAARSRIAEIRGVNAISEEQIAEARAEENRVLANPITRLLVERRLEQLGHQPGRADGQFDEQTRRAIRRYQEARDLPVTGYVSQQTLVRMLAG